MFEVISFIPTVFYGRKVLNEIVKSETRSKLEELENNRETGSSIKQFTPELYYKEKVKQIKIVLTAYVISLFLRVMVSLSTFLFNDYLFECDRVDGVSIITSEKPIGQIVLVISEFNQLLPHIVIPIAMYLVPFRRLRRINSSFHL